MVFILLLVLLFGILVVVISSTVIKKNKIIITSDKIDKDMDIVFVSDFHIGKYTKRKRLDKIIKLINEFDGDYLFVGGDLIGKKLLKYYSDEQLKDILNKFKIDKRYFVKGNHDDCSLSFYDNFKLLGDESVCLSDNVVLLGLNWVKNECFDYKLKRDKFNILLSHYPDRVMEYSKIDLALGAHSHGNQVNLPFCKFHHKERFTRGLYDLGNNKKLYVNKGLGFSFVKIRMFSCREIVKIELRSDKRGNN